MVWHVEGAKDTNHCVCEVKRGRKGVFESQCCGKGSVKTKTPKPTPFSTCPFFQNTIIHGLPNEGNMYKPFMRMAKWIDKLKNHHNGYDLPFLGPRDSGGILLHNRNAKGN